MSVADSSFVGSGGQAMYAFRSSSKMTSDCVFTFLNSGSHIRQVVVESCTYPTIMQPGLDFGLNLLLRCASGMSLLT